MLLTHGDERKWGEAGLRGLLTHAISPAYGVRQYIKYIESRVVLTQQGLIDFGRRELWDGGGIGG